MRLVDHLTDVPVLVASDLTEILWQNRLADALSGALAPEPGRTNNAAWRWFTDPALRELCPAEDRAHPEVGLVSLTCEVLLRPESDLALMVLFPTEGTDAREKLDLLRVIGSQALSPSGT